MNNFNYQTNWRSSLQTIVIFVIIFAAIGFVGDYFGKISLTNQLQTAENIIGNNVKIAPFYVLGKENILNGSYKSYLIESQVSNYDTRQEAEGKFDFIGIRLKKTPDSSTIDKYSSLLKDYNLDGNLLYVNAYHRGKVNADIFDVPYSNTKFKKTVDQDFPSVLNDLYQLASQLDR